MEKLRVREIKSPKKKHLTELSGSGTHSLIVGYKGNIVDVYACMAIHSKLGVSTISLTTAPLVYKGSLEVPATEIDPKGWFEAYVNRLGFVIIITE